MLDYGTQDHGTFRPRLGDWSTTVRSGRIQPAREADPASELPARLGGVGRDVGLPGPQP